MGYKEELLKEIQNSKQNLDIERIITAYEFAKDKPLELIDGGGLLYLLDQVGIKAKIIMPQE